MKLQRLLSLTRQALDTYGLIQDGDRIAIGVSGGKDSLTLLHALHHLRRFYPEKYELCAITVDLGLGNMDLEPVAAMCREFEIPYEIISTEIGAVLFDIRKETNPCSLCAKMRKGALNEKAKEMGCNKIAYAHHRDDVIETMMMSLFYEGRFHSFSPLTYLDRMDLTVIRPMIFVTEADVIGFRNKYQLPVCKNPCPMDGYTKRQYIKELIHRLQEDNPPIIPAAVTISLALWSIRKRSVRRSGSHSAALIIRYSTVQFSLTWVGKPAPPHPTIPASFICSNSVIYTLPSYITQIPFFLIIKKKDILYNEWAV